MEDGRNLRYDRNPKLVARVRHAVRQRLRRPHRQLDLDGHDLGDLGRLADRLGGDLRQGYAADLTLADHLIQRTQRLLERRVGVAPGTLEHVDPARTAEHAQAVVDALAHERCAAVGLQAGPEAALDVEHDPARVLGVLGQVAFEQG